LNTFVPKKKLHGAWITGSENSFTIRSKFSCIASSMHMVIKSPTDMAWYSRFIPCRLKLEKDYIKKLVTGKSIFEINALDWSKRKNRDFEFKDYMKFYEYYFEKFDNSYWDGIFKSRESELGYVARTCGDIVRLAAFIAALDDRNQIEFEDTKKVFDKFFDEIMFNIMMGPLTDREYEVLNLIQLNEEDIAKELRVTQPDISRIIQGLYKKGVLVEKKVDICNKNNDNEGWEEVLPTKKLVENV
jgi:DNA-binding CsgD family transcriptional regulator